MGQIYHCIATLSILCVSFFKCYRDRPLEPAQVLLCSTVFWLLSGGWESWAPRKTLVSRWYVFLVLESLRVRYPEEYAVLGGGEALRYWIGMFLSVLCMV